MEELLNKLIEKGWKPFGKTGINERDCFVYMNNGHCIRLHKGVYADNMLCGQYDLRQLTSKESGLWQFVCENELYNPNNRGYWGKNVTIVGEYPTLDGDENIGYRDYEYYLIESSLIDEDKLEQFLLDNIKVS